MARKPRSAPVAPAPAHSLDPLDVPVGFKGLFWVVVAFTAAAYFGVAWPQAGVA